MPSRSLGMEYRAMTYQATSQFSIIGVEDETYVEITPTAETETGRVANLPFTITLQAGDVFQLRSEGVLTGSKITTRIPEYNTCKKIVAYSENLSASIGCQGCGYDNMYLHLFAYTSWGERKRTRRNSSP